MSSIKLLSAVHLSGVEVPESMQEGEKFIKWDEDSGIGTPVTLRIDKNGFFLYWVDQHKEMDLLDIASIRDSRTGKHAKIPKEPKLRHVVSMGAQEPLEEKTITLCFGSDFVNLTFINFCSTKKQIAQEWTDVIIKLAFNLGHLNYSVMTTLLKAHTRLSLSLDKSAKIPVKNIVKMFAQNKEDRKRVISALDSSGIPSGKDELISPHKFTFESFFNFYKSLMQRTDIEKVFDEICGPGKKKAGGMICSQLVEFLNKSQRDPRLNEILHPYADVAKAKDVIQQYEPSKANQAKSILSLDGFTRYLMSDDNQIVAQSKLDMGDMDQPLAHYFINSSHNTYLIGHQLTGKSSVEIYRQCLLAGCRCVELDFWNGGRTEEPVIVHGYTLVPDIPAKDVIEAIAESAFKTSEFPVILSFENHCNPKQQAKIAQYCRESFGDMLLDVPLESFPLESGYTLPPPQMLRRKIIIKNKKKVGGSPGEKRILERSPTGTESESDQGVVTSPLTRQLSRDSTSVSDTPQLNQSLDSQHHNNIDDDGESSSAEDEESTKGVGADSKDQKTKETEAGAEISALVNYVQPVHFSSFENSEKKNRSYEMSSFDEKQATMLLKERPIDFVNYNKRQLSRVYPAGTRFDSSNFMPQVFWNAGCQLVALNYQTLDLAMQLNLGIFEYNCRSGYLLKPEFMRRPDRRFDPFAESTVDGIIAGTVSIHVLSGQFLTDKRCGTYVEVDMFGLPADTVRKKFRTKVVQNNAINPIYDDEPFVFKKVVLPELACIRIAAYEEGGRFIGHRVLPVVGLCPGYRHVSLRTECGQPLGLATLFFHVVVKDYVPDGLSDFAEALANPIKYQSELEKRAQQLAVLTEGMDIDEVGDSLANTVCPEKSAAPLKRLGSTVESTITRTTVAQVSAEPSSVQEEQPVETTPALAMDPAQLSATVQAFMQAEGAQTATQIQQTKEDALMQHVEHKTSKVASAKTRIYTLSDELVAESMDKFLECKSVQDKKQELEKKLDALKKKHEKERGRVQLSLDPEKPLTNCYITSKLMKRLSNKNLEVSDIAEGGEGDLEEEGRSLPRSVSERMLALSKDHLTQERELQEKYNEVMFAVAQKAMTSSQAQQMKQLYSLLEKETNDVMKRLQSQRRKEVKQLAKQHRDRDELVRMKREVASAMVEKGVHERVRLTALYEKKKEELEKQHSEVKNQLANEKTKARAALSRDYDCRISRVEEEIVDTNHSV